MKIDTTLPPEMTQPIVFLKGEYGLWQYKIPYFTAVVPMKFARDKFALIEDIPDSERIEWSLAELFQRDIAWDRISDDLVKYLRNESRPQFFNSLTIALLARRGHGFSGSYDVKRSYAPMDDPSLEPNPVQIGGIQLQSYKDAQLSAGKIRWDVDEILPVAVDGQHRLAAIKMLGDQVPPEKLQTSFLPVIFVVPDARAGFVEPPPAPGGGAVTNTLRRIFIDLNKHARLVSRARQILLDDTDIQSIAVHEMIGKSLSPSAEADRIPLPLVDWVSEKNKIETGPFVTTILLLHDLITTALKMPSMEEVEDQDEGIRQWLEATFSPSPAELAELMSQVQRCYNQGVPMTFLPSDLEILRERFRIEWRPHLFRLFAELSPYKALWEYGAANGLHAPQFVNLYAAKEILQGDKADDRASKIENAIRSASPEWHLDKNYTQPLAHIDGTLKAGAWAFVVVFQKALFRSFLELLRQAPEFTGESAVGTAPAAERTIYVTKWLEAVNAFFETPLCSTDMDIGKERFWAGIGQRSDGTIEYTNIGATRLGKWLSAWVCIYWLDPNVPTWAALDNDPRPLAAVLRNSLKSKEVRGGMRKLANAQAGLKDTEIEQLVSEFTRKRYDVLRKHRRRLGQSSDSEE